MYWIEKQKKKKKNTNQNITSPKTIEPTENKRRVNKEKHDRKEDYITISREPKLEKTWR